MICGKHNKCQTDNDVSLASRRQYKMASVDDVNLYWAVSTPSIATGQTTKYETTCYVITSRPTLFSPTTLTFLLCVRYICIEVTDDQCDQND